MLKKDITSMKSGQKGQVIEIQGGRGLIAKLEALDIRPGVEITKISSQLMRGPVTVQVGNTQVAIGFGMAQRIIAAIEEE